MHLISYIMIKDDDLKRLVILTNDTSLIINITIKSDRLTVKAIALFNLISSFRSTIIDLNTNIGILSLLINLLNHLSKLLITIGCNISNSIDIGEISIGIDMLNIRIFSKLLRDIIGNIIHCINDITLIIQMLSFQIRNHIIIQIFQESTGSNHSSCRTITNRRNTVKANLLNNTKDGIINWIIESQTVHTRPTVFCRISEATTIVNDRCRSIRTKSLRNYITDNLSNGTE